MEYFIPAAWTGNSKYSLLRTLAYLKTLIPSKSSAYYVCFDKEFHLLFCENDYYFNEADQNCEFPKNVDCGREVTTTPSPGVPGVECTDGIVLQRHPSYCEYI